MPLFEITPERLVAVDATDFGSQGLYERRDIQRLLKDQIGVLSERLLVIAEEFGGWLDSSRRIDLLCIDADANLVVIELKRTEDGGHMDLQALRYAAMISAMTFDQLVEAHARFLTPSEPDTDLARTAILEFLQWDDLEEDRFGRDTRIVLAAADFGKELTTTVMWLIDRGIDIQCVRLKPYRMATGQLILDVQQIIPLPEATSFQTQIGVKRQAERQSRSLRHGERLAFWEELLQHAKTRTSLHSNRTPNDSGWIAAGIGRSGFSLNYSIRREDTQVELWIGLGAGMSVKNKAAYHQLLAQKVAIELEFGHPLDWQELPEGDGCRIRYLIAGGYKSPRDAWPAIQEQLVEAMIRMDHVMRERVGKIDL